MYAIRSYYGGDAINLPSGDITVNVIGTNNIVSTDNSSIPGGMGIRSVITSYSIHYTKLYEELYAYD